MRYLALILALYGILTGAAFAQGGIGPGPGTVHSIAVISDLLKPGPSTTLYNTPYYNCPGVTSYYVNITTGNDTRTSTQAQSPSTPWQTLQKATNTITGPACFIVAHSTTHYAGVQVINGGNLASATGYAVFRCDTLNGCILDGNSGPNGTSSIGLGYCNNLGGYTCPANTQQPNYVIFDGFVLNGPGPGGADSAGFSCIGTPGNPPSIGPHHCWLINSTVSGFGETGIALAYGDFMYAFHNTVTNNSFQNCGGTQGSGIAINSMHLISGYTPTTDDQTGAAPSFGFPTWVIGSAFFHNIIAHNIVSNTNNATCATPETDHNGIIVDTNVSGPFVDYTAPELIYGNIPYNNGGVGIHVFSSVNVTVANNSAYNNGIMPSWGGANIDDLNGGTTAFPLAFYNNIAVTCTSAASVIAASGAGNNPAVFLAPTSGADIDLNNITNTILTTAKCEYPFGNNVGTNGEWSYVNAQTAPGVTNLLTTDPKWVNVSTASPGTQTTQPASTNFALASGSPAIAHGNVQPWMPTTATDAGACPSSFTSCP